MKRASNGKHPAPPKVGFEPTADRISECCAEFRRLSPRKPVGPSGRIAAELMEVPQGELRAAMLDAFEGAV